MAKPPVPHVDLAPRGLRARLVLACMLMSGVPLCMLVLVTGWFAFPAVRQFYQLERWFPIIAEAGVVWWLIVLIALTMAIAFLGGWYLAYTVINPVIEITRGATQIAQGNLDLQLPANPQDELSDLTGALNQMTGRIRESLVELKRYGDRATSLHLEINKRVAALNALLQIGELMNSGVELDAVLDVIVEKVAELDERNFAFLCLQRIEDLTLTSRRACRIDSSKLSSLAFDSAQALIDARHPPSGATTDAMWQRLDRPNLILQPVMLRNRLVGILGIGNHVANGQWSDELVEIVTLFVKQATMAMENELLLRKRKALAIRDELTGLYNESYIRHRLEEEIQRAIRYQRPCSCAIVEIHGVEEFRRRHGDPQAERVIKQVARLVQECVSEIDRVGRFNGHEFLVLLPERNKRQALELVENIRGRVTQAFAADAQAGEALHVVAAVSENPIDGGTANELIAKAHATCAHNGGTHGGS